MSFPREIISEKKKPSAAEIRRAGEEALKDEQNKNKSGSKGGDSKKSLTIQNTYQSNLSIRRKNMRNKKRKN